MTGDLPDFVARRLDVDEENLIITTDDRAKQEPEHVACRNCGQGCHPRFALACYPSSSHLHFRNFGIK